MSRYQIKSANFKCACFACAGLAMTPAETNVEDRESHEIWTRHGMFFPGKVLIVALSHIWLRQLSVPINHKTRQSAALLVPAPCVIERDYVA